MTRPLSVTEVRDEARRKAEIDYALSMVRRMTPQEPRPFRVYFISCSWGVMGGHAVKIGMAHNPKVKMRAMQIHCPYELTLCGVMDGGREVERELHRRFAKWHIRGEWHILSTEIQRFIKENCR